LAKHPQPLKGSKKHPQQIQYMEKKMHAGAIKPLYQRARELRNNATHAETLLWGYLKTKPYGFKFRRQHPFLIYILDFYCHSLKLVIEVDGKIHSRPDVKEYDEQRQALLQKESLIVLRFKNDLIENRLEDVIFEIDSFILKKKDEK
jgi:very-short-patch-repair endonuclease